MGSTQVGDQSEQPSEDWLKSLVFARDVIDWSDSTLTPRLITKQLLGKQSHWLELGLHTPEQRFKYEAELLRFSRNQWHEKSKHGKPYYQHFLTLAALAMPAMDIHPNTHDIVMVFCNCIGRGVKVLNLIGSQNSAKSTTTAVIGTVCMLIDPHFSTVKVANPFDKSSDNTIFGDFRAAYRRVIENPNIPPLPDAMEYKDQYIRIVNDPKMGKIEQLAIREIGLHKGTKAADPERKRGILMHAVDEINEINSAEDGYMTILSNIMSQEGFISITGQNFTSTDGNLGGLIATPKARYAGNPDSYEQLIDQGAQENLIYHSKPSGVTLRLSGLHGANILAGRTIYEYLFTQRNLETVLEFGEDSPYFCSQVLAFPSTVDTGDVVMSPSTLDNSRFADKNFVIHNIIGRVAFLDPSFTVSGDKPMYRSAMWCDATVVQGDGVQKRQQLLIFEKAAEPLQLIANATYTPEWIRRVADLGVTMQDIVVGSRLSVEDQMAIQSAERNKERGIMPQFFGFDPSLRAEIVKSITRFVGMSCFAVDYMGKPSNIHLSSFGKNAEDCCFNMADQASFALADAFSTKSLRGFVHVAGTQLTRTRYTRKGEKMRLEDKSKTKARLGCSPDDRDATAGCVIMARKHGWVVEQIKSRASAKDSSRANEALRLKFMSPSKVKLPY